MVDNLFKLFSSAAILVLLLGLTACNDKECKNKQEYEFRLPLRISPEKAEFHVGDTLHLQLEFELNKMLDYNRNEYYELSNLPIQMMFLCNDISRADSLLEWPNYVQLLSATENYTIAKQWNESGWAGGNNTWYSLYNVKSDSQGLTTITVHMVFKKKGSYIFTGTSKHNSTENNYFSGKCKGTDYSVRIKSNQSFTLNNADSFINNNIKLKDFALGFHNHAKKYDFNYCINVLP